MTAKFLRANSVLSYVAAADIASGDAVLVGARVGCALLAIASGAPGPISMRGVFRIAKVSGDDIGQGALVYWDDTAKKMTTDDSGNTLAGFAFAAAGVGVLTVDVSLNA